MSKEHLYVVNADLYVLSECETFDELRQAMMLEDNSKKQDLYEIKDINVNYDALGKVYFTVEARNE